MEREGKREQSCRSGTPAVFSQEKLTVGSYFWQIINPLLTKLVHTRSLDIGPFRFWPRLWTSISSWSINTQKNEFGQNPANLTTRSVDNL